MFKSLPRFAIAVSLILAAAAPPLFGQPFTFTNTFGNPSIIEQGLAVHQLPSGSIYFFGHANADSIGGYDVSMIKSNGNGNILWEKHLGGANNDFTYRIIYRENAFIVCGLTTNIGGGFGDAFILKVDTLGNQQWFKTFGETDQKEAFTTLAPTNDGGFVCGGFISPPGSQISDFWLVKFDENGEEEWSEFYGGTLNEYVMSVLETIDGGIAAVGDKERSDGSYNAWLIKTDGAGNLLWDTDLMQTYNTGSRGMVTDADGDFYITGESDPIGAGFLDIYLAKVSSAGSVQWQKQIGGNRGDAGFHIAHPVPGRLLITGYGYNPRDENQDAVVVVTDTYGNVDTTLYYGDPSVEIGYHIFPSVYGGFLVASASFQADNQYFLIYDDLPILAGIEQNPPSFSTRIKLFPNPVSSSGTVFLNTSVFHPQITLTDVAGRILFDKKFDGQITSFTLPESVSHGVHFVKIVGDSFSSVTKVIFNP